MASEIFSVVGRIMYEGADKVDKQLQNVDQAAAAAEKTFNDVGKQATAATKKVDNMGKAFKNASKNIKQAGTIMTAGVTTPIIAAGAAAFNFSSQMEQTTGMLQAQLGMTAEEAQKLGDVAQNLWENNFGANVQEAALAVEQVRKNMLQIDDSEIEAAAESAFILRDAFGLELTESTALADSIMANFGGTAEQAFDVLTTGYQNGLDYAGDFADTMREYGPIFSQFGMDGAEALSFLETAQSAGFRNLDVAADLFKEFTIRASEGSDEFAAAVGQMDSKTQELYKGFQQGKVSGDELFYGLISGMQGIEDPQARFNAGVATMGTMFEDSGETVVGNLVDMRAELEVTAGATQEAGKAMYDTFTNNLQGGIRKVQGALEPFGNSLLNIANNALPPIITAVTHLADWLGNLPEPMQAFIALFAVLLAAAGPVLVMLGFMATNLGALAPLFAALTGPVGVIIALVTALSAALAFAYTQSETFRNAVNGAFGALAGIIQSGLSAAVGFIKSIFGQVVAWWKDNNQMILEAVRNVWVVMGPIIKVALSVIIGTIRMYWNLAKQIIQGAVNLILGVITVFAALLTGNWAKLWDGLKQMLKGALQVLWAAIQITFLGRIMGIASKLLSGLMGIFGRLAAGLISRVKGMNTSVRNWFNSLKTSATQTMQNMQTSIVNTVSRLSARAGSIVSSMINSMKNFFNDALSNARSIFNSIKNSITKPIRDAKNTISGYIEDIKGFFSKLNLKFPKIKMPALPHFSLKGEFSLKPPRVPKLGVEWYDKGGIFDSPSIIGVGEKRPEFVGALDDLREIVRTESGGGAGGLLTIQVPVYLNGREIARAAAPEIDTELARRQQRDARAKGRRLN